MFKINVTETTIEEVERILNITSNDKKYKYIISDTIDGYEKNFINIIYNKNDLEEIKKVIDAIKISESFYLIVRGKSGIKKINIKKIDYLEVVEEEIVVVVNKDRFFLEARLKDLEVILKDKEFLRISKSTLVNMQRVDSYLPISNYKLQLELKNGDTLEVNRLYTKVFKELIFKRN